MLITTAAVHSGASGAAVVDQDSGELLGMVTSNARHGAGATLPRLNFCIAGEELRALMRSAALMPPAPWRPMDLLLGAGQGPRSEQGDEAMGAAGAGAEGGGGSQRMALHGVLRALETSDAQAERWVHRKGATWLQAMPGRGRQREVWGRGEGRGRKVRGKEGGENGEGNGRATHNHHRAAVKSR